MRCGLIRRSSSKTAGGSERGRAAEEKARFVVKMVSRGTVNKDRFEKKTQALRPNLNARFATRASSELS